MNPIPFNQLTYRSLLRSSSLRLQCTGLAVRGETLPPHTQTRSTPNVKQLSRSSVRKYETDVSQSSVNVEDRSQKIAKSRAALDDVLRMREGEQRRAHHVRRAKISAAGMLISMAIPLLIVMNLNIDDMGKNDTDEEKNEATESAAPVGAVASSSEQSKQQHKTLIPMLSKERADSSVGNGSDFDGKPVIMQRGMSKPIAHDTITGEDTELVPTGNSTVPFFPRTITLPVSSASTPPSTVATSPSENAKSEPYVLLGLGIRTVSFLSIQVYVVGLYVPQSDLNNLQQNLTSYINPLASALIPNEKAALKQSLLDPASSQEIWSAVLHGSNLTNSSSSSPSSSSSSSSSSIPTSTSSHTTPIRTALRIVPVRNTDFAHLRDGWVRGITTRTQSAARNGSHEFDDERFGTAMRDFKALFGGKGRAPKGSVMVLARDADGKLEILMKQDQEREHEQQQRQQGDKIGHDVRAEPRDAVSSSSSSSNNSISSSSSTAAERYTSLGAVTDERISRLIVMGYLAGKDVSSEGARRDIVDGVMGLVERPAGTIETKVE